MGNKFLIILLVFPFLIFSQQKLEGKYCLVMGEGDADCIEFFENNRLNYVQYTCLGISSIGSGNFQLENENLKLIFDKVVKESKSYYKITNLETTDKKEVKLNFIIKDNDGFIIPAHLISDANRKHFFYDEYENLFYVDKNSPKANYRIEMVGYENLEIQIDNSTDKIIEVTLYQSSPSIISDRVVNMAWKKINDNEFKTGPNYWDRFKKMER